MRQYLVYSGTFHLAAGVLLFFFLKPALEKAAQSSVYSVDFIGSPAQAPSQAPAPKQAAPPAQKAEPAYSQPRARQPKDYISANPTKREPFVLPAPSVLKDAKLKQPPRPNDLTGRDAEKEPAESASAAVEPQPDPGSGGVSADFPNFPYPWYITQVRAALWNEWSSRMPSSGAASAVVVFRITRAGKVEGLRAEKTAGNKLFDFAALASVDQAGPFPPLPADYKQPTLTVHVEFKSSH
ncbi:MAG: TonB family protein [Elusimicrobiales bacterium]|nr:TonB family protein [Elusimicrobiales bacterium]